MNNNIDLNDTIIESGALARLTEAAHEILEAFEAGEIDADMIANLRDAVESDRITAIARFLRSHAN